ncbi:hypothetical protein DFH09DRAFT_1290325 [Mycena vulgaris]|nr:hypothetical protein DFH09DRAFT_1290325 [Mycena vulgaris]
MRINGDPLQMQGAQVVIQTKSAGEGHDDPLVQLLEQHKLLPVPDIQEKPIKTVPPAVLVDRTPNLPRIEALMSEQERQAQRSEEVTDQGESAELASGTWGPAVQPDFWGQQVEVGDGGDAHCRRGREAGARRQSTTGGIWSPSLCNTILNWMNPALVTGDGCREPRKQSENGSGSSGSNGASDHNSNEISIGDGVSAMPNKSVGPFSVTILPVQLRVDELAN